jgi:hypothetical protein
MWMKSMVALTALAGAGMAAPASAAPLSGVQGGVPEAAPAVEKAAYRRCWWHHGHRHCRWVATRYYDYGYYDDYPYGYGYGYGPSVGFFFGGGGGGHRHGGWHGGGGHFGHGGGHGGHHR